MIDRNYLREVRTEIEAALQVIARKRDLDLKLGAMSFTSTDFKMRVEFAERRVNEAGVNELNEEAINYTFGHARLGLEPDKLGTIFHSQGHNFRFVGINLNRPKYPISAVNVNTGKAYKFGTNVVAKINEGKVSA